ncbi:hypothetical protein ACVW2L_002185 [Mucilaginibacter sp. HD30]
MTRKNTNPATKSEQVGFYPTESSGVSRPASGRFLSITNFSITNY